MVDGFDPNVAPEAALAFTSKAEVERMQQLAKGGEENLEEVAQKFEAIFLGFLIKQMWESVDKSELLPEGPGRQIHEGLLITMLADHLAESGGIGIADSLTQQLKTAAAAYEEPTKEK